MGSYLGDLISLYSHKDGGLQTGRIEILYSKKINVLGKRPEEAAQCVKT